MKLQELAVANPTKQAAKVFESYFGTSIKFDTISQRQAKSLLTRVRSLISEHRRTPGFHKSEQNPAYLKLIMLEQALATQAVSGQTPANPQQQAALQTAQVAQNKRTIQDQIKQKQKEIQDLQRQMNNPVMASESRRRQARRLAESEIQQAQVVLASQDMVDQVQKMSEQVSAMQFKDLPALVDQIKNEVGIDQATQFNGDASAALSGLLQNLQGAKQQLEAALGVVTGQAPQVPGQEAGLGAPAPGQEEVDIDTELPTPDGDVDIDAEMDANVEPAGLGRERR